MIVLVIGASGMLGNAVFRLFSESQDYKVFGSVRSIDAVRLFQRGLQANIVSGICVENCDSLLRLFSTVRPELVINCVGLVKQVVEGKDPLAAIVINALLPHRLARMCEVSGARLIHMGTDCVFSGLSGNYKEVDEVDGKDLYGRTKFLGEVDYPHAITLRTSIIGHELNSSQSLIGWFLAQNGPVKGFRRAVFSGLPTVEIARIIRNYVIPRPNLHGIYHVSSNPINKFDLLTLVSQIYGKSIDIEADDRLVIDRSLDSTRFRAATGYSSPSWPDLVRSMLEFG